MELIEHIQQLADELVPYTIAIRNQIHQNPELSFQEFKTSQLVCDELVRMGIPYELSPVKPGVIATIDSGKPGKLLMLRADMDALPIQESTGLEQTSQVDQVMHACGHDVHTANLLTVGDVLNRTKSQWSGRVKLVFQPAEESGGGGREMIAQGLMEELPDACFALHVEDGLKGQILAPHGYVTAYSDSYRFQVKGTAAHSSAPQKGVDAIYIAANIITALHGIVSRNLDPLGHSTLNIGTIQGGAAANIIADEVEMVCVTRNQSKESRDLMLSSIESTATGIATALGGSCTCTLRPGYAAVYNNLEFTEGVRASLKQHSAFVCADLDVADSENYIIGGEYNWLGAEDFGFYAQTVPSCFIMVGTGGGIPKHSKDFIVEEPYIKMCTRAMLAVAADYLTS